MAKLKLKRPAYASLESLAFELNSFLFVGTKVNPLVLEPETAQKFVVGLERFELSSITPEATSLDQASRQPLDVAGYINFSGVIKTLATVW